MKIIKIILNFKHDDGKEARNTYLFKFEDFDHIFFEEDERCGFGWICIYFKNLEYPIEGYTTRSEIYKALEALREDYSFQTIVLNEEECEVKEKVIEEKLLNPIK